MKSNALLIAKNWPEPASTAAGRRSLDILQLISNTGYDIHVASPADATPFQTDLTLLGYQTHRIAVNDSQADRFFQALSPKLVIYDRFVMEEQFGWRIKTICPQAITLLDTSDLHCLRHAREIAFKKGTEPDLYNDIAIREISALLRCDLTLMISQVEMELLKTHFAISDTQLFYLPFMISDNDFQTGLPRNQRHHIISLGGLKHEPNRDAVRWLKKTLWPMIRQQLPSDVEMHVVGAYADHAMNQMNNPKERFFIKGRVDNALTALGQYRVNLAALRFGAGQKGKILEGWLTDTPTLTTPIGIEAMAEPKQLGYQPVSEPEALTRLVTQAYLEDAFAQRLIHCGTRILQQNFNITTHASRFQARLQQLTDSISQHRHQHFYSRLIWQNQLRASEFMSRWIELKNK